MDSFTQLSPKDPRANGTTVQSAGDYPHACGGTERGCSFPPVGPAQAPATLTGTDARSPIARFLDGFLQERNIQWVLAAGMIIVLGSTLMLVVTHWEDYTPA